MTTTPTPASQQSPATFCKACGGSGSVCAPDTVIACETCFGSGRIVHQSPARSDKDAEYELLDGLREAVSDFRKATHEFARGQDPSNHAAMMEAQRRIFDEARSFQESAPSSERIATWQERIGAPANANAEIYTDVAEDMQAEIDALRAALARRATAGTTAAPSVKSSARLLGDLGALLPSDFMWGDALQAATLVEILDAYDSQRATAGNAAPDEDDEPMSNHSEKGFPCLCCDPEYLASNTATAAPGDLPPLPIASIYADVYENSGRCRTVDGFTADQMREVLASNAGAAISGAKEQTK